MNKLVLVFFLFLFSFEIYSQTWCAPGAKWVFRLSNYAFPFVDGFIEATCTGTVMVNGKICYQVGGPSYGWTGNTGPVFPISYATAGAGITTYAENGIIYYMVTANLFDTLANFNAKIGEGWYTRIGWDSSECSKENIIRKKLVVTDTGHITINGFSLKKLEIESSYLIVERIGPLSGFFFQHYCCHLDCWDRYGNFSCYKDDNFPVYSLGSAANCNFVGIRENSLQNTNLNFFPNPGAGLFTYQLGESAELQVMNAEGRVVRREFADDGGKHVLDLRALADGFYFVKIIGVSGYGYSKLVKAQN